MWQTFWNPPPEWDALHQAEWDADGQILQVLALSALLVVGIFWFGFVLLVWMLQRWPSIWRRLCTLGRLVRCLWKWHD